MSTHPIPPGEPSPATLGGQGPSAAIRRGALATRPAFLQASVLPVLVGTAWGSRAPAAFDGWAFGLALAATVLAHAATNVYNDVADDLGGTDPANVERLYPYTGGSRFIQNGVLQRDAMARLAGGLAAAALLVGALLAWRRGTGIVVLGLAGLGLGYGYSRPGVALAGRGLGELACGLGLGALPLAGSAWLQAGRIDAGAMLLAVAMGTWTLLILLINEVPDAAADAAHGKRTLAVRLGVGGTRLLYEALTLLALAAVLGLVLRRDLPGWALPAALGLALAGFAASVRISRDPGLRAGLRRGIEITLAVHGLGGLVLLAGCLLG
ncbi:MAG: prenyltransferase [Proteobacteria bacterium]|nr:prenyltransferase [Pseudomonadota bacterium]